MAITFDDKPIHAWAAKHPQNAPTWWSRMASSSDKQFFGQMIFRSRHGLSEPTKAPTDAQKRRIADFVLENAELKKIVSAEICDAIAQITDLIREDQAPPEMPEEAPAPPTAPPAAPAPQPRSAPHPTGRKPAKPAARGGKRKSR
jgi:hypothetical protein